MRTASILSLIPLFAASAAWAQSDPVDLKDIQDQINAEVAVTKGRLDDVLQKLGEGSSDPKFASPDYAAKAVLFQERVRKGRQEFEEAIGDTKSGLFAQLYSLTYRYDSTFGSESLPPEVRDGILKAQKTALESFAKSFGRSYRNQVMKLVRASGLNINELTRYMRRRSVGTFRVDPSNYDFEFDYTREVVDSETGAKVFPFLRQGCYSQSCVRHSAMDEATYVALVLGIFNRDLEFKLADGTALRISKVGSVCPIGKDFEATDKQYSSKSGEEVSFLLCSNVADATNWISQALSAAETFPLEFSLMPGKIDEKDIPQAAMNRAVVDKMRRLRARKLAKLAFNLNEPESNIRDFRNFFEYFCLAPSDYPHLRPLVGGCMTRSEVDWLVAEMTQDNADYHRANWSTDSFEAYVSGFACEVGKAHQKGYCQELESKK